MKFGRTLDNHILNCFNPDEGRYSVIFPNKLPFCKMRGNFKLIFTKYLISLER